MSWMAWGMLTVAGAGLAWADHRSLSVPTLGIAGYWVLALGILAVEEPGAWFGRLGAAGLVLILGGLLIRLLEGKLGEADVLFVSALSLVTPFWPLLVSVGLGCVSALVTLGLQKSTAETPVPFLPSLAASWSLVTFGGLVGAAGAALGPR